MAGSNDTVTLDFTEIRNTANKIAEAGDNTPLASSSDTVKGRFDTEVRTLYSTIDDLLRTYRGTDAYALRDVIYSFRPHFDSMSKTMSAHADFLRSDVNTYQDTQSNNIDNTKTWDSASSISNSMSDRMSNIG